MMNIKKIKNYVMIGDILKDETKGVMILLFLTIGILTIFLIIGFLIMLFNNSILFYIWIFCLMIYCCLMVLFLTSIKTESLTCR